MFFFDILKVFDSEDQGNYVPYGHKSSYRDQITYIYIYTYVYKLIGGGY